MVESNFLLSAGALVLVFFLLTTHLAAMPIRREVERATAKGQPLPRIVGWWQGVAARGWWIIGAAALLIATGGILWSRGQPQAGTTAAVLGLIVAAYLLQALYILRIVRQASARGVARRE